MNFYQILKSPIGPLTLVSNGDSLTGVYMNEHRHGREDAASWQLAPEDPVLREATTQLEEFFQGTRTEFELPLSAEGTEFQMRCWEQLSLIPYGETLSYGEMARRLGNPDASRAVGAANGRNPISIIVPCHRVIGSTGKLVGFGGGLPRKSSLLSFERAIRFGEAADEYWAANPCG